MPAARLVLDAAFSIAPVPRRLFGSFVEHMGRCVYTGIYEPGHPSADDQGLRTDVLELTRRVGPTVVRYPGGNFVSNYRWEDGIGPREDRPRRLDLAWHSVETNQFGLHEFDAWAQKAGTEVMMAVNLGTRGLQEACDLLEYTNHPGGTYWSDRRIANGAQQPFDYKLWCLGNEMDGPWQVGHKTPAEYGRLANETGKAMRLIDSEIELVACGSSNSRMPTFGRWESEVLELCYDTVDYVSCHAYYEERDDDPLSFLASAVDMDYFIDSVVATADAVKARGRHTKTLNLSFDEWNVWYQSRFNGDGPKPKTAEWRANPRLIEDEYTVTDAVVVGTLLNSLLRHGDRVTIANQAQLVNVIGLIRSEEGGEAWLQTIAHPFEQVRRLATGQIIQVVASSDLYDSPTYTDVPVVDAAATHDAETGRAALFVANRSLTESATLDVDLRGLGSTRVLAATTLHARGDQDRHTTNLEDHGAVAPVAFDDHAVDAGRLTATLPALSWTVFELDAARG
ncbi:alpha-N-arabinofuranosidase [Microlunatus capsulatus]|uniref:non-reducing end alpha-L-arabinofuranosidase n=1 Tax=Microlunatus capsulatus TaxID=99117 RepID=A0ABS4ZE88_9ACTN|nr:alpha-N-arabinofuranosidase [Microlunatus capsulatus]MBP2418528.1 alpha-N-arabinofuranosidase [Microlunatus capsulatus]